MVVALTSISFFKGGKIMNLKNEEIDKMYNQVADELSISDSVYESSKASYEELAKYLSKNIGYKVNIYPQGSMALGTTIKTITKNDDYDLDVVCEVEGDFDDPEKLKNLIGDALKNSERYIKMLDDEGKRCWTLNYSSKNFHLDILPATSASLESTRIIITNKDENTSEYSFKSSDPKAYANWFLSKQENEKKELIKRFYNSNVDSIEPLKDYKFHTKLQKATQLLKRHRDIKYRDVSEKERKNKPISIIITTILAELYSEDISLYELIERFANNVKKIINVDCNGNYVISNPINKEENFADKWIEYPERKDAFFKWIKQVEFDLITNNFLIEEDKINQANYLKSIFGDTIVSNVYSSQAINYKNSLNKYINHANVANITTEKTDTQIKGHTFYGI